MEWKTIESAPKDKTMIVIIGRYPNGQAWSDAYCAFSSGKEWSRWPHWFPPTHWVPLPLPPSQEPSHGMD